MSIWRPWAVLPYRSWMSGRLFVEIEGIGGRGLHFEGDFVGFDAGFQLGVLLQVLGVEFVELLNQIQLAALFAGRRRTGC